MTELNLGYIKNHINNNNYNIDTKNLITDCYIDYEKKIISVYINCNDKEYMKILFYPEIENGLTLYNGQYYFFDQCLTDRLSKYTASYSYYVYPVRNELAEEMIKNNKYNTWLMKYESFYYYGGHYKTTNICGINNYFYPCKFENDAIITPYKTSSTNLKENMTITDFFIEYYKHYKEQEIEKNRNLILRIKIQKLKEKINGELV